MKNFRKTLLFLVIFGLFSCAQGVVDPLDDKVGLRKSDFDRYLIKDRKGKENAGESVKKSTIPELARLDLAPPKPILDRDILSNKKTVSFAVTDQVALKDVLIELGRAANIDVDLDPKISGGIVLSANNRPLGEVVERICQLGKLRYEYKNGVLHFERDLPYLHNYYVDYLVEGSKLWSDVKGNIEAIMKSADSAADASMTVNKTAGMISIFATKRQHVLINNYLKEVRRLASAQVIIEAKVVEVSLDDEFSSGINWDLTSGTSSGRKLVSSSGFISGQPFEMIIPGDINASVSALEKFGTSRTLSSPRIHAINNQKATLNFAKKLIYFKVENTQTNVASNGVNNNVNTVTSEKIEEDVGVELTIIPSINLDTDEVTLNVRPKITAEFGTRVIDPASPTDDNGVVIEALKNEVPQIKTRELNTTAKIQSGNVLVIGGLMEETAASTDQGVPFLHRIPILGYLFKSASKASEITETVIFIKATIVDSGSQVDKIDRQLQEKFDTNRRRFF